MSKADYSCGAAKINLAVSELPMFACLAGEEGRADRPMFCHKGTVHFEHRMEDLELAWKQASLGILPDQPVSPPPLFLFFLGSHFGLTLTALICFVLSGD